MEKTILNYRVIIEPDKRTGTNGPCFTAYCPKLGIADDGDTIEQALSSVQEGIKCYLEALIKDGQEVPPPDNIEEGLVTSTKVSLPKNITIASL